MTSLITFTSILSTIDNDPSTFQPYQLYNNFLHFKCFRFLILNNTTLLLAGQVFRIEPESRTIFSAIKHLHLSLFVPSVSEIGLSFQRTSKHIDLSANDLAVSIDILCLLPNLATVCTRCCHLTKQTPLASSLVKTKILHQQMSINI
jgi:hypothetical protein